MGLKETAPLAGFSWRSGDSGGTLAIVKYEQAIDEEPIRRRVQRPRNGSSITTRTTCGRRPRLRQWLDGPARVLPRSRRRRADSNRGGVTPDRRFGFPGGLPRQVDEPLGCRGELEVLVDEPDGDGLRGRERPELNVFVIGHDAAIGEEGPHSSLCCREPRAAVLEDDRRLRGCPRSLHRHLVDELTASRVGRRHDQWLQHHVVPRHLTREIGAHW